MAGWPDLTDFSVVIFYRNQITVLFFLKPKCKGIIVKQVFGEVSDDYGS